MVDSLARLLKKKHGFSTREQEAFLSFWRAMDLLNELHDAFFKEFDLSAQQYNVLRILRGEHPTALKTTEIKKRLVTRASDVTRLLDRLENTGLATRDIPKENRRVVLASITRKGLDLLRRMDKPLLDCHNAQLGHLKRNELDALVGLLERVREPHELRRTNPAAASK